MSTLTAPRTVGGLLRELGGIPGDRVRLDPAPGTATEADLHALGDDSKGVELIRGTLVEKPAGAPQESVSGLLAYFLFLFVLPRRAGHVANSDTEFRMSAGNLRKPDASFMRAERMPRGRPHVIDGAPDLCVEVLSDSNTAGEMALKRAEYFDSGCRLVWEVEIELRTVAVYTGPDAPDVVLRSGDTLTGGDVLPGFTLDLAELWATWDGCWPA